MVTSPSRETVALRRTAPAVVFPFIARVGRHWRALFLLVALAAAGYISASAYYRLPAWHAPVTVARIVAAPLLGLVLHADSTTADVRRDSYWVGVTNLRRLDGVGSWRRNETQVPGLRMLDVDGARALPGAIPFVYEQPEAHYLRDLVETYDLSTVTAGAVDEYDAMIRLGAWVGTRFDHGADAFGRRQDKTAPVEVIRLGQSGKRYWCEVAARLTVHAATALGWQARLVTASATGYTWDHAVAEIWSNQFRKWFVLDTDFNIVYEADGVPLSAFELCHRGPALRQSHRLTVRAIAPPKPSLPTIDLLPYYAYVHVDLRNDWNSRFLGIGSPEGGDRATWWTSRQTLGAVMTAKVREDREERFNWPVNAVSMHALRVESNDAGMKDLLVGLTGYSPTFAKFQTSLDDEPWTDADGATARVPLSPGRHLLRGRVMTASGHPGPEHSVSFVFEPPDSPAANPR